MSARGLVPRAPVRARTNAVVLAVTALGGAALPGCVTVSEPPLAGAGSGGTSSTGTLHCEQACQDGQVAFAVDNTGWLIYNQNIAGQPSGNIDRTASCPLSGTAHVTGTVGTSDNGVTSLELSFDLENCGVAGSSYTLTFTGALTMTGTFTSAQNDVTFSSSALTITGQLKVVDDPTISDSCPVSVTDTWDHNPSNTTALNGLVCGRPTGGGNSSSAAGGAGGSSGGGSGGGGASGGSGGGSAPGGGVTTCGNCPGQLECSTSTGQCVPESCACFYVIDGSDGDSSWYLANGACFMCEQDGLTTGDCSAAATAAAQAVVNCQ